MSNDAQTYPQQPKSVPPLQASSGPQARAPAMSRWKAAGIHFSISIVVATVLIVLMLAFWYPPPYFELMGGPMLVVLIAGCDVTLGPLITLIIFKSGKKGLKFDLTFIACAQLVAMSYGLYMMFEARPVYTVFAVDRLEIVSPSDIDADELEKARGSPYASLSWTGPRLVGARLPADQHEQFKLAAHGDLKGTPRYYVPYESMASEIARKARKLSLIEKNHPEEARGVADELAKYKALGDDVGYLPFVGRFRDMTAVIDMHTARILAIIDVAPW